MRANPRLAGWPLDERVELTHFRTEVLGSLNQRAARHATLLAQTLSFGGCPVFFLWEQWEKNAPTHHDNSSSNNNNNKKNFDHKRGLTETPRDSVQRIIQKKKHALMTQELVMLGREMLPETLFEPPNWSFIHPRSKYSSSSSFWDVSFIMVFVGYVR